MVKKKVIIYDYLNTQVWVDRQRGSKTGTPRQRVFGKDHKKFTSNVKARAYAYRLARRTNGVIYDKYYGTYIKPKLRRKR